MKNFLPFFARLFLTITVWSPLAGIAQAEPITVGVIGPLTGPLAEIGVNLLSATKIAENDLNTKNKLRFIFEDDQYSPKQAVTAAQKLLSFDHAQILIVWGTPGAIAVSNIAETAKVPMITMTMADSPSVGKQYVFKYFPKTSDQIQLVDTEINRRAYEHIAVINTQNESMESAATLLSDSIPEKIVLRESVLPNESDLKTLATRIKMSGATATFMALIPPTIAECSKQLRRVGYKGELFGVLPMRTPAELARAEGSMEGVWFASIKEDLAGPLEKKLTADGTTFMPDGALIYDVISLVLETVSQSKPWNEYLLLQTEHQGIFGVARKNEGERSFAVPVSLWQIKSDKYEQLPH